jgi:pimeloyl-ACP methyl ester carboxylesterase
MASAAQPPAERFAGHADLSGVRLWYTDSGGSGVPLVLLHANTGNADSWQYNILGFVEAGYRVIAFDRRGWGRSTANPDTGPQPGTIAEDLHALMEYLKTDRFHLVGVAGGGFAAYDYVLWHPERLRSLVVAASGGAIVDEELSKLREKTTLPGFRGWPAEFREVSMGYMANNPEGLQPARDSQQFATEGRAGAAPTHQDHVREARNDSRAHPVDARRSGSAESSLGHALPARPYSRCRVHRAARSSPLDQLGAARGLQPKRT